MPAAAAPTSNEQRPHSLAASQALDDPLELETCTRWVQAADGRRVAESFLQVSGMVCAACADIIEQALLRVDGVDRAQVLAASQRATVRWDAERTSLSNLVEAIRAAGYDAVPDAAASAREMRHREHRAALWRLFVASFCAMQVMMFATPSYVAADGDLAPDMRRLLNWGAWVLTLPVMWFAAGPYLQGAWKQLRMRRIGMDVPVALGLLVTFVASMGATFDPQGIFGRDVYFDSLTMFLSFLLAGRYLELRARHRAADGLEAALARMPEVAERQTADGGWDVVSTRRLVAGDAVRVAVGTAFAADGVLLQGQTRVDESLLTGESTPVSRSPGDAVVGASINVGAPVVMRVERVGADTRYEAIVAMMRDAMSQRPAGARMADRWAGPFLWAVIVLAVCAAAAWSIVDPSRAVWVAVSVLIVTCPCAFSLAAPATLVAAAGGLARHGVVFKRLDAIEVLARASRLFIDKTGTLTEDRIELRRVDVVESGADPISHAEALAAAGSLAQWSSHPLSQALAQAAGGKDGCQWTDIEETPGKGLQATDAGGHVWRLGSAEWTSAGPMLASQASVWLAREGRVVAEFEFDEALRADALETMAALRASGLRLSLLSGDSQERATAMAERLGLDDATGNASPERKLACVVAAQNTGEKVVMVGDGVNDAPVLTRADASLAMGQGALVARANADAVVASGRLADLMRARLAAIKAMRIVRQNLIWAAVYNAACIPLALTGLLPPWAAGLGMASSSLLVIGNALRASP